MNDFLSRPWTRRQVMTLGAVGTAGVAAMGGWSASLYQRAFFDQLTVTPYTVTTPKWPADLPSIKIAFLTDLHVGCLSVDTDTVKKIVAQVNALNADLILLGGDFLTNKTEKYYRHYAAPVDIAAALQPLAARLGVYSVLGNHDWANDGQGMWDALTTVGIKVLENSAVFIPYGRKGFWLAGLADYLTRHPNYGEALRDIRDDAPQIVLSHDPYTFKDMPLSPVLQLSGHTHGGQVALPLIGPVISTTPGSPLRWSYGLIEENNRRMIVSSGVGTSIYPVKNTPNEVVLVTIDPAATLSS